MAQRLRISRGRLRRYVLRAVQALPPEFRRRADNVMLVVENHPKPADYSDRRGAVGSVRDPREPLMGVYRGVPLSERAGYQLVTPDQIAIFRKPLLRLCRTRRRLYDEVELTVLHEFGHYLGLSEEQVEHL
jgi:predicted Zn-dependent protease with MMP-like domain